MGGSTLPTASTPGYGTFHGKVGCDCVIEFLTVAERLGILLGLIEESLDVVQLTGDADASAGVHSLGSAFDLKQRSDPWVRLFRNMGASYWPREGAAWVGNEHGHGSIPCPHDDRVAYQHLAYRRGYNGLGRGWYGGQYLLGYGAKDPCWRPSVIRTRAEGLALARKQIEILEDPLSALEDYEQRALLDDVKETRARVFGMLQQRYYVMKDGAAVPVSKDTSGAAPARVMDSLDGDYLRRRITEGDATTKAELSEQLDTLAKSVADLTSLVTTLTASVATTNDKVDALTTKVDALPKA